VTTGAARGFSCGHVFFPEPTLYLAVNYQLRPSEPDWANVLCEGSGDSQAIRAFLSPFDAMLEAAYASSPGKPYHVVPAHQYVPSGFLADHNGRLALDIQFGWPAHDGALICRRNGSLAACCKHQEQHVPPERAHHIAVKVDADTLTAIERVHENAGLFAYKEAFSRVIGWAEEHRHRAIATAIQKIPGTVPSGSECNQIALYDPEFEQWHFVPSTLLDDLWAESNDIA